MRLIQRRGSIENPPVVAQEGGGFGPPGGVFWTAPVDVLSDRPKTYVKPPSAPVEVAGVGTGSAPAVARAVAEPLPAASAAQVAADLGFPIMPDVLLRPVGLPSTDISATSGISGFVGSCLVDSDSGLMLASEGGEALDLEAAAALNTQVVRAEHEVIEALSLDDHIEDILITMNKQLHFIRPLEKSPTVFLYVCLDKKSANLGMARMQVNRIESGLQL